MKVSKIRCMPLFSAVYIDGSQSNRSMSRTNICKFSRGSHRIAGEVQPSAGLASSA